MALRRSSLPKSVAKSEPSGEMDARERILETASALFYKRGVRAVGVDLVVAEAGVAKTSLYRHFRTKDDLIAAFLAREDEDFWSVWRRAAKAWCRRRAPGRAGRAPGMDRRAGGAAELQRLSPDQRRRRVSRAGPSRAEGGGGPQARDAPQAQGASPSGSDFSGRTNSPASCQCSSTAPSSVHKCSNRAKPRRFCGARPTP